jgi:hypothetical protein
MVNTEVFARRHIVCFFCVNHDFHTSSHLTSVPVARAFRVSQLRPTSLTRGLFDWSVPPTTTIAPTFFEHRYSRLLLNVYKLCKPNPPIDLHPRHPTCRLANPLIAPPPSPTSQPIRLSCDLSAANVATDCSKMAPSMLLRLDLRLQCECVWLESAKSSNNYQCKEERATVTTSLPTARDPSHDLVLFVLWMRKKFRSGGTA